MFMVDVADLLSLACLDGMLHCLDAVAVFCACLSIETSIGQLLVSAVFLVSIFISSWLLISFLVLLPTKHRKIYTCKGKDLG